MTNDEASAYLFRFKHINHALDLEAELFYAEAIAVVKAICCHMDNIKKPYGVFHECPELCEKANKIEDRKKRIEASKNAVSLFFDAYQIRHSIFDGAISTGNFDNVIFDQIDHMLSSVSSDRLLFMVTVTASLDILHECVRKYIKIIAYKGVIS